MVIYSTMAYFLNFTPQLTRCQLSLRTGSGHVAADSFQRHAFKRGVFNKKIAKYSITSGEEN